MYAPVDTHLVTISPPSNGTILWEASCSYHDMTRYYRNRVEAYEAAMNHITELLLRNSLERNDYSFDDGEGV